MKFLTYGVIVFIAFILQNTVNLLAFGGIKPDILIPFAVAFAMHEGEFAGGIMGMILGMLCDYSAYHTFGFNTILLMILCVMIGLAVIYYMKNNKLNSLLLCGAVMGIRGILEYYFVYAIWKYENASTMLLKHILPTIIYSLVFMVPAFVLVGKIKLYFEEKYNLD